MGPVWDNVTPPIPLLLPSLLFEAVDHLRKGFMQKSCTRKVRWSAFYHNAKRHQQRAQLHAVGYVAQNLACEVAELEQSSVMQAKLPSWKALENDAEDDFSSPSFFSTSFTPDVFQVQGFGTCCGYPVKGYNGSTEAQNVPVNPASGGNGVSSSGWLFLQCLNDYCPILDTYAPGYGISDWFQQLWKVSWPFWEDLSCGQSCGQIECLLAKKDLYVLVVLLRQKGLLCCLFISQFMIFFWGLDCLSKKKLLDCLQDCLLFGSSLYKCPPDFWSCWPAILRQFDECPSYHFEGSVFSKALGRPRAVI